MAKKFLLLSFFIGAFYIVGFAQYNDSLTVREAEEIRYKAERLINRELRDLLNNIANTASDEKSLNEMIVNSHSGERNKIFYSPKVLVEDDINPAHKNNETAQDIEIDKYLRDFDVLYTKSDERSVTFNNIKVSSVKKFNYIYVNVYYSSFFSNQNKAAEIPYSINNRVAEVKVEKRNNEWAPYIVRIGFFTPADTVNNFSNDMVLKREHNINDVLTLQDSAAVANLQTTIEEDIRRKEQQQLIENDRAENERFIELLNDGDEALRNNNFTDALAFYARARELRPYDPLPLSKINKANRQKEQFVLTATELHDQYIRQAVLAENNRDYQKAIGLYNNAIAHKPETKGKYKPHVDQLTAKFRILDELEEKYKAGLYRDAIRQYDAAIRRDNKNSDFFLGRAKCHFKIGEYQKAMKDFNQAYDLDHQNLQALELRAALHTHNKDYFKAQTDYKTYLTINKYNTRIYQELSKVRLLINQNNFTQAIADLDEGIAVDPKSDDLYIQKGILLTRMRELENAEANFSTALKIDSTNAFSYFNRGKVRLNQNQIVLAGLDFEQARKYKLDSANQSLIDSYSVPFSERANEKYEKAEIDSAIVYIDYAIAIHPAQREYWFKRGQMHFKRKDFNESITSYNKAIALMPDYTEAFFEKGEAFYQLKEYKSAIEAYSSALKLNPKLYKATKGIGESSFALQDYNNAIINLKNSISEMESIRKFNQPKLLREAFNTLGRAYYKQKELDKAMVAFKDAIRRSPENAEAHFNKGIVNYDLRKYDEAIADLSKAIGYEKTNPQWYYYLGSAYQLKKDYKKAVLNYSQAISMDSLKTINNAVYNRGFCYLQLQQFDNALTDYLAIQSLITDSSSKAFNKELGFIYLNLSKYDSSILHYEKSLAKDTSDGRSMYGIACAKLLQKRTDEALAWFEKSFKSKAFGYKEIKGDKLIASIKGDKTFRALIRRYF